MLSLVVRKGERPGTIYRLGERNLTIGRDRRNLVQIVDPKVSRRHAAILWVNDAYVLSDLRSQNGVEVNGAPHERGTIQPGDRIRVGDTVLEVVPDRGAGRDATRAPRIEDTSIVSSSTVSLGGREAGADEAYVDVGKLSDRRQLQVIQLLGRLRAALRGGEAIEAVFERAAGALEDLIGPDRTVLYRIEPDGEPRVVEIHRRSDLDAAQAREAPHIRSLRRAAVRGKAVLETDIGIGASQTTGIAAVMAVPLEAEDGRVIGVLYADAFDASHHLFVPDDLEVLKAIGDALTSGMA